jgi:hypothetical protein
VAEPLDESVDEEANDARNYCGIFGQWPKMAFGPTLVFIINAGRVVFIVMYLSL